MNEPKTNDVSCLRLRSHSVHMENRSLLTVSGVTDVGCFNEHEVALKTDAGDMNIAGECLHITRLDLDNGQVVIEGEIGLIEYEEPIPKKKGSLLSRLFS